MRSHAKCPRSEGPLRLFVLMGMEICLLDALYRLQSLPYLRTPGADPSAFAQLELKRWNIFAS